MSWWKRKCFWGLKVKWNTYTDLVVMSVLWLYLLVLYLSVVVDVDDDVTILSLSVCLRNVVICVSVFHHIHCLLWAVSFTKSSLKWCFGTSKCRNRLKYSVTWWLHNWLCSLYKGIINKLKVVILQSVIFSVSLFEWLTSFPSWDFRRLDKKGRIGLTCRTMLWFM